MEPYTTSDLGLAAYLYTEDVELLKPIPTRDPKRFDFVFLSDDTVEDLVRRYFAGQAQVNPRDYFYAIKRVRNTLKEPYIYEADN